MRIAGMRAVLERDFLVFTSRPRFLVLRTLAIALPALLFVAMISTVGSVSAMLSDSSMLSKSLYATSLFALPTLTLLLAPVLAASSIAQERSLNTLSIVLATPVSPLAFVFAKFLSRLGVVLVLFLAVLPLGGLCLLYGGIPLGDFGELIAFIVGIAVFGTAAGLVASAYSRSVATAAMTSGALAIGVPLVHSVWVGYALSSHKTPILAGANLFCVWTELGLGLSGRAATMSDGPTFLAWSCLVAALAVGLGAFRVARESAVEARSGTSERTSMGLRFENPVLDRALRGSLFRRPRLAALVPTLAMLVLDAGILAIAFGTNSLRQSWSHILVLGLTTGVVVVTALTASAHSIAAERQTGALDMLLATRLTPREVVRGKSAAFLAAVAPLVAIGLVHGLVAATLTELHLVTVIAWLVGTVVVSRFAAAIGLWASAVARTAGKAVLISYAVLVGGSVVHITLFFVAMIFSRFAFGNGNAMYYMLAPSPGFMAITPLVLGESFSAGGWEQNQESLHMLVAWVFWAVAYVVVAAALVRWAGRALERRYEAR